MGYLDDKAMIEDLARAPGSKGLKAFVFGAWLLAAALPIGFGIYIIIVLAIAIGPG